jgi:uncharacterized protein YoxC
MDGKVNPDKEDIDAYNKAVKEMNAAVNTYNQTNNQVNTNRTQVVKQWNEAESSFADNNMPHYKA